MLPKPLIGIFRLLIDLEEDAQKLKPPETLLELARLDVAPLLQRLNTSLDGLTRDEAALRLKQYGPNEVARKKPPPVWLQLLKTFNSPFNYLLLVLGLVSFLSGNITSGILIGFMVFLSVLLRFLQEYRAGQASEKLKALVTNRATVYRRNRPDSKTADSFDIPLKELAPGDIISLSAGDLVPADVRLLEAKDLHVNQATLTGESFPAEKNAILTEKPSEELSGQANLCFMGTSVISGLGKAVVLATGDQTYFGNLATKIVDNEPPSRFEKDLNTLSWLLIRFIAGMVVLIFFINGLDKQDWLTAFLFALSVGVGLTPEMLPMIVTSNLSRGALALSRKKVIVKRLSAIQNLGAMDVLCTDKTGTLTQNRVILYKHLDLQGKEDVNVLRYAYLNSYFESGLKNLLDDAILEHAEQDDSLQVEQDYYKVDEIPFDFERRKLSVIMEQNQRRFLVCKGAVDEVLAVCTQAIVDSKNGSPMTPTIRERVRQDTQKLNEDGFRVIAIAYKDCDNHQDHYTVADEQNLILTGYIAFLDPPKETAATAVRELSHLGIELKILTGDNERVTRKICNTVNLPIKGILLGHEVESLSEAELASKAEQATIFAQLNPGQKERVIQALQHSNHVVGCLGDGINDSPALKAADVGLSVDNAVDIAKESADMILLEQNLLFLRDGVLEGRKVFGNILKYIRMTTSSNFGNVLSMVGASLLLPFLPMKPIQIITQNLLYDFSQIAIPFDKVDPEFLEKPHPWQMPNIERFLLAFGPVSSLFDYVLFAVMWFVFKANTPEKQALFQTGWFIEGLMSQTLIVHLIRTRKLPFLQSWAAPQLIVASLIITALGIYLPHSPLAWFFGFVYLPAGYFLWLLGILTGYFLLTQYVKHWFIGKYGYD